MKQRLRNSGIAENAFKVSLVVAASAFTSFFAVTLVPLLIDKPDVVAAFAAGFVNPYASGYSTDVIISWAILVAWVAFEAKAYDVKHGWICVLLGVVPGVAVGFAVYLLLRHRQVTTRHRRNGRLRKI
ncbi:MAG: DUF2834 domain-containing protein [Pseudomonadota bacterium]